MTQQSRISRRRFLQTSAALTTAGITALSPPSYASILGANDRIHVGVIGLGAMGNRQLDGLLTRRALLNIDVRQTCDVYRKRAESAAQRAGHRAKPTKRYEEVLENPDINAVFIATPDHWHAKIAVDAIQAGKHVYLEPPLGHTAEQALEVLRVAQAHQDRVRVQVGVPATSFELCDQVRAHLQRQDIGKLLLVNSSYSGEPRLGSSRAWETIANPLQADLDWDRWLGHRYSCAGQQLASRRAWDPGRYFQFHRYWDYSGGMAGDLFFNRLTFLLKATGLSYPKRVIAAGGSWAETSSSRLPVSRGRGPDDREVPDLYNTILEYPGGATVTLIGSAFNAGPVPTCIIGQAAMINLNDPEKPTSAEIRPQGTAKGRPKPLVLAGRPGGYDKHRENFIKGCRDPKVELYCPVSLAVRANVALVMGVSAYREQKIYRWEPHGQQIVAG